ncbi:hypothetical protein Pyn_08012 [Prunus yedoensis var. nudiflora]|uniref:Uncharacterized protein n=1 Tax=Prunus yedoensis var. nudiflora TaxID=2094558 RepID=A0A314V0J6_PRUYE|nr:hypothetical protein Pyn_23297 [Prunus yedoensis var. nudiflora]PQP96980.1 hypothetical protein Pyn_08012 [Prunus yedoensis var. nudiflora]
MVILNLIAGTKILQNIIVISVTRMGTPTLIADTKGDRAISLWEINPPEISQIGTMHLAGIIRIDPISLPSLLLCMPIHHHPTPA